MKRIDSAISRLLRYDLSETDVVKWVLFARQMLAVVLVSVVLIAGLSAVLSIKQAQSVLDDSLQAQAHAIAQSVAKAAFVPLTLEDDAALAILVDSYRQTGHLGRLTVRDNRDVVRRDLSLSPASEPLLRIREPILPVEEHGLNSSSSSPIGVVEVGMKEDWIDRKIVAVALTNVAISGAFSLAILILGALVIRHLVERTRALVGEANLVAEVRRANAELEAFSYSVAHDLRAPARAISGFSQALLEDHADQLDNEGKDFLRRVNAGSQRMGELINDLLSLSRVTRAVMRSEPFDLSAVAREVCAQLQDGQPERTVEFSILDGLRVEGDPNLLRVALENLLGNSWKYTRKHPRAKIEFGRERQRGQDVYFVRDDGAGFDMAYADKLFRPFSRLHKTSEFEGTGIGLATVQRIVDRHGGKIWAESSVEKGSTFYFTLGEQR